MATLTPSANLPITAGGGNENNNFQGSGLSVGERKASDLKFRSLLIFNLADLAGLTITSAVLRLYDDGTDKSDNDRTMRVYRVLRAGWTEAGATWNTYDGTNAWGMAGCANTTTDREATDIGSISMPAIEVEGWKEITLTTSKVQEMIDGSPVNYGFLLQMDTEINDEHSFNSTYQANDPQLVIEVSYTMPAAMGQFILTGMNVVFIGKMKNQPKHSATNVNNIVRHNATNVKNQIKS